MEVVREDAALTLPEAVQAACHADHQSAHTAAKCATVVGFDDQVGVVAHDGIVHEAEAEAFFARGERRAQDAVGVLLSHRGQSTTKPDRDV